MQRNEKQEKNLYIRDIVQLLNSFKEIQNKKTDYLKTMIKGIEIGKIVDLYLDCDPFVYNDIIFGQKNVVIDLMEIYPDLTFGEIKQAIEGYFQILNKEQPIKIKFPRILVERFMDKHTIKETCEEFGYTRAELRRNLAKPKKPFEMTKEEYLEYKMNILRIDLEKIDNHEMTLGQFRAKYTYGDITLTPKLVKSLIGQEDSKIVPSKSRNTK